MLDTIQKLYTSLCFMKAASQRVRPGPWYVQNAAGHRTGPFHAAELAYRIHAGWLEPADLVFNATTRSRTAVEDHPFFAAWLSPSRQTELRLVRGLMLCVREYIRGGHEPCELSLPPWAHALLTSEEREAFERLELQPSCSARQARHRVRQLTITHHPDRGGSEDQMKEINGAYAVVRKVAGF